MRPARKKGYDFVDVRSGSLDNGSDLKLRHVSAKPSSPLNSQKLNGDI